MPLRWYVSADTTSPRVASGVASSLWAVSTPSFRILCDCLLTLFGEWSVANQGIDAAVFAIEYAGVEEFLEDCVVRFANP